MTATKRQKVITLFLHETEECAFPEEAKWCYVLNNTDSINMVEIYGQDLPEIHQIIA